MNNRCLILILTLLLPTAVWSQSRLTRSHKKLNKPVPITDAATSNEYVTIAFYANNKAQPYKEVSTKTAKGVFELSPKGQQAYIKAMLERSPTAKELHTNLGKSIVVPPKKVPYHVEKTTFVKTIEIDVNDMLRGTERVGRIDELAIRITLPDTAGIHFKSLQNLSTKYEVVDFGKIGLTRNQSFTLNAGFEAAGTGSTTSSSTNTTDKVVVLDGDTMNVNDVLGNGSERGLTNKSNLGATYNASRTVAEEVNVQKRRIAMKGTIGPNEILIYQEGAPTLNLNDKITLQLLIEVDQAHSNFTFNFDGLYKDGVPVTDESKHKVIPYYATVPGLDGKSIPVNVAYEYLYREVTNRKGKRSPGEWDDKVTFARKLADAAPKLAPTLVAENELLVNEWYIKGADGQFLCLDYYGSCHPLVFYSLKAADDFLYWLKRTKQTSVGGHALQTNSTAITANKIAGLHTVILQAK